MERRGIVHRTLSRGLVDQTSVDVFLVQFLTSTAWYVTLRYFTSFILLIGNNGKDIFFFGHVCQVVESWFCYY